MSRKLRQLIFTYYLEHCRPPTLREMSLLADEELEEKQVSEELQALQDAHHLVLYDKKHFLSDTHLHGTSVLTSVSG
jgi:hypothetical protein